MPDPKKPKHASSHQLEPGTLLLDRYLIVSRVGGGGMGSVYQARDKRLADRLCAVKEMIETLADQSQRAKAVEDFEREAEVLAQLDHPSIPTIYDYFIEGGKYYLVMRWIGGGDLAEQMRLRGGIVDEATVSKWAVQICDVLHYIHSQKPPIIYRDLKPANLMIDDKTGRVMLVDFGIARIVRPTEKGVTAIGTMGYAPPELFAGEAEPRSDIYSLGATMFHMLTGSDPQDNPLLIFDFSKNPRPCQINPAISPEMERILMKMVAHRPEDRQLSALELKRSLEEHSGYREIKPKLDTGQSPSRYAGSAPSSGGAAFSPSKSERDSESNYSAPLDGGAQPSLPSPDWVFCGHCGEKIGAKYVYCVHCGNRILPEVFTVGSPESVSPPAPEKDIEFTVYHPVELRPAVWYTLLAYAHTPGSRKDVEADSNNRIGDKRNAYKKSEAGLIKPIKPGAQITVVPYLQGCRFNPPHSSFHWFEEWHQVEFRMQSAPELPGFEPGAVKNGKISFYIGPILIAEIKIWAHFSDDDSYQFNPELLEIVTSDPYQSIFVSYAHKDSYIVDKLEKAYSVLGWEYLRDVNILRSGEKWSTALLKKIDKADIFQLCWSNAAKQSVNVEKELAYAVGLHRPYFIRPVYWETPIPQPPSALSEIHFAYLNFISDQ